ncbi:hypothetical protein [Methylobacterium aquaticum]|nr:hypothetical protein [Methylobacterium aquaticum]
MRTVHLDLDDSLSIGTIDLAIVGNAAGVADGEAAAPARKEADHG